MKEMIAIVGILLLSACSSVAQNNYDELHIETIDISSYSGVDLPRMVVVRDQQSWSNLWKEHKSPFSPAPPMPQIDFSEMMAVGVFIGARSNGCYSVKISNIRHESEKIIVEYRETVPFGLSFCTYSRTTPSHVVAIRKSMKSVEFIKGLDVPG